MERSGASGLFSLDLEEERSAYLWSLGLAEFPEKTEAHNSVTRINKWINRFSQIGWELERVPAERGCCSFTGSSIVSFWIWNWKSNTNRMFLLLCNCSCYVFMFEWNHKNTRSRGAGKIRTENSKFGVTDEMMTWKRERLWQSGQKLLSSLHINTFSIRRGLPEI